MTRRIMQLWIAVVLSCSACGWQRQVEVVGHSGSRAAPENTIAACVACFEEGADAVEIDVRTSKDGVLVNFHDATLDRTTDGSGLLADHTLAELKQLDAGSWYGPEFAGERIPTLAEMLLLAKQNGKKAYLDVKLAEVGDIAMVVDATQFPQRDLVILAWSISGQLAEHVAAFPDATVVHAPCCPNRLPESWSPAYFEGILASGADAMAFNYTVMTRQFIEDAHVAGMPIILYTVNSLPDVQRFADFGARAIITDHPGMMLGGIDWDPGIKIRSLSRGIDGSLVLRWRAMIGESYRIERSPFLGASDWTTLETVIATDILPTFTVAPTSDREFFRVVEE